MAALVVLSPIATAKLESDAGPASSYGSGANSRRTALRGKRTANVKEWTSYSAFAHKPTD